MKLSSFSITNFRSITQTHKIDLSWSNVTVFVWKNNEWKSNILKALNICMNVIRIPMFRYADPYYVHKDSRYARDWYKFERDSYMRERDFPIKMRDWNITDTNFLLEFQLTREDIANIKKILWKKRFKMSNTLVVHIIFNNKSKPDITIDGIKEWEKVITYISDNIDFTYIPAIRTEREILSLIDARISSALYKLKNDPDYEKAINKIRKKQDKIFWEIEKIIQWRIKPFIPNVKNVKIKRKDDSVQLDFWSIASLYINDWTETEIEYKWDGIKNLVSISLLHKLWNNKSWLVAIEEPESHLHPEAIHYLNDVINDLWNSWQILISTHNPLFVNRENIASNIIVWKWEAKPAENIREIRKILWVTVADNLINANKVLIVEWLNDYRILKSIFSCNDKINKAIKNWTFAILPINSSSNLSYELARLTDIMVDPIVLFDNDPAGINEVTKAKKKWVIEEKNIFFISCKWKIESEIEDLIDVKIYKEKFKSEFGVDLPQRVSKSNKKRSYVIKSIFNDQWKNWDNDKEIKAKSIVSKCVIWKLKWKKDFNNVLYAGKSTFLKSFVKKIEEFIK